MIDFEKIVTDTSDILDESKQLFNIQFEYYVYPKYNIQGCKYIIKLNPYRKVERCIKYNTSKKEILKYICDDITLLMRGIADNYGY